jgi:hypothetical protein
VRRGIVLLTVTLAITLATSAQTPAPEQTPRWTWIIHEIRDMYDHNVPANHHVVVDNNGNGE